MLRLFNELINRFSYFSNNMQLFHNSYYRFFNPKYASLHRTSVLSLDAIRLGGIKRNLLSIDFYRTKTTYYNLFSGRTSRIAVDDENEGKKHLILL